MVLRRIVNFSFARAFFPRCSALLPEGTAHRPSRLWLDGHHHPPVPTVCAFSSLHYLAARPPRPPLPFSCRIPPGYFFFECYVPTRTEVVPPPRAPIYPFLFFLVADGNVLTVVFVISATGFFLRGTFLNPLGS